MKICTKNIRMCNKYQKMEKFCIDFPNNDRILFMRVLVSGVLGYYLSLVKCFNIGMFYGGPGHTVHARVFNCF